MAWYHTAREDQLSPIGEYKRERYCITVCDSFDHFKLATAARVLHLGSVQSFLFYAVNYVLRNDRRLRRMRTMLRKGARQLKAVKNGPLDRASNDPEAMRRFRHREAMEHFYEEVDAALAEGQL